MSQTTTVWRIAKKKHINNAFDGEGAKLKPGRWNNRGVPLVYTASSIALAMLEILVHLEDEEILNLHYYVIPADLPANEIQELHKKDIPKNWDNHPPPPNTRAIGDHWIREASSLALSVPSVTAQDERIVLINPLHSSFNKMNIGKPKPLNFDRRLINK